MMPIGSPLFASILAYDYGDQECRDLVWSPTPWIVDAYTGRTDDDRFRKMVHWCAVTFGPEADGLRGYSGRWQCGNATIFGWTWFGFTNEADMSAFLDRWPSPLAEDGKGET